MSAPILSVKNVFVGTRSKTLLHDISFDVFPNEILCIVGESGSGKSLTLRSLLGSFPSPALALLSGSIHSSVSNMGFVPQSPENNLNPFLSIGSQLMDTRRAQGTSFEHARQRALFLLRKVGFSQPEQTCRLRPHQLSGGMQQRVLIASALMNRPPLLLLDEPTTALDVMLQAEILDLLVSLKKEFSLSMIFVTHDLGIVSRIADRLLVMHKGHLIESGLVEKLLLHPTHSYTKTLVASVI